MKYSQDARELTQARHRHTRSTRFMAGLRDAALHHQAKLAILLGYLLAAALLWGGLEKIFSLIPYEGVIGTVFRGCVSLAVLVISVIIFVEIMIAFGTPRRAFQIQTDLIEAGFTNAVGFPPLLLSVYRWEHGWVYEFDQNNISFLKWDDQQEKNKIEAALKCVVIKVKPSEKGNRMILYTVAHSVLPDKVYWNDSYLSQDDFILTLGIGLTGELERIDLAVTPHLLIGGGSGSGKSVLAKCLLMQSIKKGATVILADFKGGVDYAPVWHKRCKMVFDLQNLLAALEELTDELERRRGLFVKAGTPDLTEYNKATGEALPRYIFACDEVAEVLDTTGLDKAEKEVFSKAVRHLSLLARQGRAFGIHLFLATQRPSADLIPGQIRTNLALRICGRADDILSRIILDDPIAAAQIPLDAQGRFVTNMGQIFQGFLFDDSILDE